MKKLRALQRELVVPKTQWNEFGKYYFRSSEDILMALKPLLEKYECTLVVDDDLIVSDGRAFIKATVRLNCGDDITACSSFAEIGQQGGMSLSMATNSASSFAKKQALQNMFLIDDTSTPVPSKEEIEEREAKEREAREKKKQLEQQEINAFIDECKADIDKANSLSELKSIFGMCYREAKKYGKPVMDEIEVMYKARKLNLE